MPAEQSLNTRPHLPRTAGSDQALDMFGPVSCAVHTLDLGQARFRFSGADDVQYPDAIRKNQAEVKRDELIEALDQRFGRDCVNTGATSVEEDKQICQRIWPTLQGSA